MNEIVLGSIPRLGVFKNDPQAFLPAYATELSACFDLKACLCPTQVVSKKNALDNISVSISVGPERTLTLLPGDRALVPTGLILDIPAGYSVRLHPRSGLASNKGVTLANAEGVIDADYVEPVFVLLTNTSDQPFTITHGDRICQGELVKVEAVLISELQDKPLPKSSRDGGFGSTGQ